MNATLPLAEPAVNGERSRLRTAVLHYGGLLGWSVADVMAFTEALTNRRWRDCGCPEFLAVLDEYLAIMQVIQVKRDRRTASNQEVTHASGR